MTITSPPSGRKLKISHEEKGKRSTKEREAAGLTHKGLTMNVSILRNVLMIIDYKKVVDCLAIGSERQE